MNDLKSSYLDSHIALLEQGDSFFRAYWSQLNEVERRRFRLLCHEVASVAHGDGEEQLLLFDRASDLARRYLSCIPQKDLDYSRRPPDWSEFVANEEEKRALWFAAEAQLRGFLEPYERESGTRLYGGVKPLSSFDEKLGEVKTGWAARRRLRDTWDAVRCRLVAPDLSTLRQISVEIWQYYLDSVIKCSNYYSYPQDGSKMGAYRAIHFLIEIEERRWIEVQVLTAARDAVGVLDYAFTFKRKLQAIDRKHDEWLRGLSLNVNIFDARSIPAEELRVPGGLSAFFLQS